MIRASRTKHLSKELRGAIVGQYLAGISYEKIANSLNVSVKTVKRWVNRHRTVNNLDRRPQPGQVRKLNEEQRTAVVDKVKATPFTNAAVVGREYGVNKNTIRKIWMDAGIYHGIAVKKPKLTQQRMEARLGYALENLNRNWDNVIFSDEKTYQTDRHQKLHVYRPRNSRFDPKYIQENQRSGRVSAGYWGWICKDGPGELIPVGGKLNSHGYLEILEDVLKSTMEYSFGGFKDMVFMQDNCSIHTAKVCNNWFDNQPDLVRIVAPANSPDLNPIENVRAEMSRGWESVFPRNLANLDAQVVRNWEALRYRPEYFKKLYDSMPARMNAVIDARGGHTRY